MKYQLDLIRIRSPAESFLVSLRNPTNAKIGGFYGLGVVTIANDD